MSTFLPSNLQQASFSSFTNSRGGAFAAPIIPAIKRLYPLKEVLGCGVRRHPAFFSTTLSRYAARSSASLPPRKRRGPTARKLMTYD
ncbi:hypothetical protein ACNKHW_25780 [Shigella flexneri]